MESIAKAHPPSLSLKPQFLQSDANTKETHENEWYRQSFDGYAIKEQPLYTKRPLRMIVIGAGAAGLEIAYKAEQQLENVSVQIYEKNNDVGGTWLENRYPGCTCDIPSHSYQWSFWRNPRWSAYYSGAHEIWQYLKDFAVKHDLEKYVAFEHRVQEAKWHEVEGVWEVTIQKPDGQIFVDKGEILASCHGVLKLVLYLKNQLRLNVTNSIIALGSFQIFQERKTIRAKLCIVQPGIRRITWLARPLQ